MPLKKYRTGIAAALDLRSSWGAKDFLIGLKNYSARKTMDIISKIRDTDAKSKGLDNPNTGVGDLMKELIFFIYTDKNSRFLPFLSVKMALIL